MRSRECGSYFGVAADRESVARKPAACRKDQGGMDVKVVGEPRPCKGTRVCASSHLVLAFNHTDSPPTRAYAESVL